MEAPVKNATRVTAIVPQFRVDNLEQAIAHYRDRLGFDVDFIYDSFYASVSRDGFAIHLKEAPKFPGERAYKEKADEHLDAHVSVKGVRELFSELQSRGATIIQPLADQPWSCTDFYVEDPDGYVLCFSELNE
jgi:uncharacterized glyoxalase superfamily protein PhnB